MLTDADLERLRDLLKPTGSWIPDVVVATKLVNGLLARLDAAERVLACFIVKPGSITFDESACELWLRFEAWLKACGKEMP